MYYFDDNNNSNNKKTIVFSLLILFFDAKTTQNGSTPRDIASQQGYRALAELLEEYERRLANGLNVDDDDSHSPGGASNSVAPTGTRLSVKPPSVFNRDVITSPRNSPMRATSLEQYLRSTGSQPESTKPS